MLASAATVSAQPPIDIGSRLELMVDDHLIEQMSGGARFELHRPIARQVAITHDEPWEGNVCAFHTVFRDGDIYRMYYRGAHRAGPKEHGHPELVCYAESRDGIRWTKPDVGIVTFDGSKHNNIIWDGSGSHAFTPFKDANPNCKAAERYKALAYAGGNGLYAFKSADGVHWSRMHDSPVITNTNDSQSVAFWDTTRNRYVCFHKWNRKDPKAAKGDWLAVGADTSDDFVNWSKMVPLEYPGSANTHMYTNAITPYYRAPHIFVGLPTRTQRNVYFGNDDLAARHDDISDVLLMTSRDGRIFKRWDEAFIRPGQEEIDWQRWGGHINTMAAAGIAETQSDLPGNPRELSIYSTEGYFFKVKGCRMRRFTLRIDGFVSVQAPLSGGEVLTRSIRFNGGELVLNFSASGAGTVQIEMQDAAGTPIEGFSLADCPPIRGDTIERIVSWKGGSDVSPLSGTTVRLRFVMRDADLYSFRFR